MTVALWGFAIFGAVVACSLLCGLAVNLSAARRCRRNGHKPRPVPARIRCERCFERLEDRSVQP